MSIGGWLSIGKAWSGLFLKSSCPLCDRPAEGQLCAACLKSLRRCQLADPQRLWQAELPVFAWGTYGGLLKRAIAVLKYENQPQLARVLGTELAQAWLDSGISYPRGTGVIPIPLHETKLKQRGYNQAQLLAERFCEISGLRLYSSGLKRVRQTQAQFGLSSSARSLNLTEAFVVGNLKRNSPILLLDDIYTTGATARSAAQTLQQQGISVLGIGAIALAGQS
ncbi:ComF family protein [Desertifilum sp. FACHB-1129]|uniref:Alpha-L-fucosidase n=2 Tax=Desertifilaceae TaxID=1969992 RepID=A0A1E5QFW7_9CYAN|nr:MULTISPECIES: ComF family protein [unclassified Desertifilum]MDA0210349.1 ComF family protein [Cyanobacteria bacterium FC1]OEJ73575.1 hypothetical protein BH720_19120 [Desertifilum tharense IPPAS B-1220]MBD2310296.1 ComF family protein [Desertifilum sp. FACHB-1129]MBD2322672.1 ComF family protein [Desertifilum sp. FACHB-866]MBD2333550.1 ComF family protein [Desertifilum sp. FACHB-868]